MEIKRETFNSTWTLFEIFLNNQPKIKFLFKLEHLEFE